MADWRNPPAIKRMFNSADILRDGRVVFDPRLRARGFSHLQIPSEINGLLAPGGGPACAITQSPLNRGNADTTSNFARLQPLSVLCPTLHVSMP